MKKKRTGKKNSEPRFQSKAVRDAYREANPEDEWLIHLGPRIRNYVGRATGMVGQMRPELNHVFTNPRRDAVPILITLSKHNHDFFHREISAGRVICLLVKCRKGEADIALWDLAFGKSVYGWCQNLDYPDGDWLRPYWLELLKHLAALDQVRAAIHCE